MYPNEKANGLQYYTTVLLKCIHAKDVRLVKVPKSSTFAFCYQQVQQKFPGVSDFVLKYKDSSGDMIIIESDDELQYAFDDYDPLVTKKIDMYPSHLTNSNSDCIEHFIGVLNTI
jgi:hypothetical protein